MKKFSKILAISSIIIVTLFVILFGFEVLPFSYKTQAQNSNPMQGSYALQLNGTVIGPDSTTLGISILGQFDIDNQGTARGVNTVVISGIGQVPSSTFTCQFAEVSSNGTGKLVCQVVDPSTGPNGRTDTFFYVLAEKRKEIRLTLISGVPGAILFGAAKKQ